MARPIRLVVFDNNGTAYDDLHVAYGSVQAIFQHLGLPCPNLQQYRTEITADFMQFYWNHGVPRTVSGAELNKIRKAYYYVHQHEAEYRTGFRDILRWLKGEDIHRGMCSAEMHEVLISGLIAHDLHEYFDPMMIHGSAWPKKSPILLELAEYVRVSPSECAYVDDTVDGMEAAKEAGFMAVGFVHETGYNPERRLVQSCADRLVRSFSEIPQRLSL